MLLLRGAPILMSVLVLVLHDISISVISVNQQMYSANQYFIDISIRTCIGADGSNITKTY